MDLPLTATHYLPLYAYEPTNNDLTWQVGMLFLTEEEAIAYALSMVNVKHIRILEIHDLPRYEVPSTLKTASVITTVETIDYGKSSNT